MEALAQMEEHQLCKVEVTGSSPVCFPNNDNSIIGNTRNRHFLVASSNLACHYEGISLSRKNTE